MGEIREIQDIGLVLDATESSQAFFSAAQQNAERQVQKWEQARQRIPALKNIVLHVQLFDHGTLYLGSYENYSQFISVLSSVKCKDAFTELSQATLDLAEVVSDRYQRYLDFTLVIGDGADIHEGKDSYKDLRKVADNSQTPIVTLLHSGARMADEGMGINANHRDAFRIFSEASGVKGAPIEYNSDIDLVDYILATASARAGVSMEIYNQKILNPKVWEQISNTTAQTIYKPEKEEVKKRYVPVPLPFPWLIAGLSGLGGIILGAGIGYGVCQWLDNDPVCPPSEKAVISAPSYVDDLALGTSVKFNNAAIGFEADSARIPSQFKPLLDNIGKYLQKNPHAFSKLVVEGHTSLEGSRVYNKSLSQRRAQAIVDYLNINFNIRDGLLEAQGLGEERPLHSPEILETDKQENRRVILIPQL